MVRTGTRAARNREPSPGTGRGPRPAAADRWVSEDSRGPSSRHPACGAVPDAGSFKDPVRGCPLSASRVVVEDGNGLDAELSISDAEEELTLLVPKITSRHVLRARRIVRPVAVELVTPVSFLRLAAAVHLYREEGIQLHRHRVVEHELATVAVHGDAGRHHQPAPLGTFRVGMGTDIEPDDNSPSVECPLMEPVASQEVSLLVPKITGRHVLAGEVPVAPRRDLGRQCRLITARTHLTGRGTAVTPDVEGTLIRHARHGFISDHATDLRRSPNG